MKITTIMKYHLTPVRMLIIKHKKKISVGKDVEERKPLSIVDGNVNWYSHYGKEYVNSFKKIELPCDPDILILGIYLKKMKTLIHKDICTPMFYCSIIYNSQDLETTSMSIDG